MAVTLILKNTLGSILVLPGTSVQLPALGQDDYTGQTTTILKIAASNGVRTLVQAGTVIVNNGTSDLPVLNALNYLDILWSTVARQGVALLAPGYVSGARLAFVSTEEVSAGSSGKESVVADSLGVFALVWNGVLTADITVAGAGGLQTGQVEAADTWYQVLIIGDTSGTNATNILLVPDGVGFLQAGYDVFRRVGWVRNDGSSDFIAFFQSGLGSDRTILYDESVPNLRVLNGGSATDFTDIDLSILVPPIGSAEVFLQLVLDNALGLAGDDLRVRPKGSTKNNIPTHIQPGIILTNAMQIPVTTMTDQNQLIQYRVSRIADIADIIVSGYKDDL